MLRQSKYTEKIKTQSISKYLDGFLHLKPRVGCQISTLIFEKTIMEGGSPEISHEKYIKNGKVLDHSIQVLKSVKDPGNTFDLMPKWSRTFASLIYFSWDV
jgi:hypothetical protein